mgnify:CR=1 FL=1
MDRYVIIKKTIKTNLMSLWIMDAFCTLVHHVDLEKARWLLNFCVEKNLTDKWLGDRWNTARDQN